MYSIPMLAQIQSDTSIMQKAPRLPERPQNHCQLTAHHFCPGPGAWTKVTKVPKVLLRPFKTPKRPHSPCAPNHNQRPLFRILKGYRKSRKSLLDHRPIPCHSRFVQSRFARKNKRISDNHWHPRINARRHFRKLPTSQEPFLRAPPRTNQDPHTTLSHYNTRTCSRKPDSPTVHNPPGKIPFDSRAPAPHCGVTAQRSLWTSSYRNR
jgi:hypothetical protein